jgi:hypothetical protein
VSSALAIALFAGACRENVERKTDTNAATAPLDIPATDANTLLQQVGDTHARFEVEAQDGQSHGMPTIDLILPKTWKHVKPSADSLFSSAHGTFSDQDPKRPALVAVAFTPAPHDVPVDAYLQVSLANEGWQLVQGGFYPGPFGLFYEATATRNLGNTSLVRRSSARLHHGTILVVSAVCPRERWDELKKDLWLAHVSTELQGTKPDGMSEERKQVSSLPEGKAAKGVRPPLFTTVYPASWTAEVPESTNKDVSGIHVRLILDGVLGAYIGVRAERHAAGAKPAVSELITNAKKKVEAAGAQLISEPQPTAAQDDPRATAITGWLGGYIANGRLGDSDVDVRMGFVQNEKLSFTMIMLSPKQKSDVLTALRARRAFEIIRAGISTREF